MPLTPEDIQSPRSPRELHDFVESIRERSKTDPQLRKAGHLRKGFLKEYFDEIVPLSRCATAIYPGTVKIRPVLGNQGYDAEVYDEKGELIERVEIANPIDGQEVAQTGRELAARGYGGIKVEDAGDDIERLIPIIADTARKKSKIDYSDATVVFNISGLPPMHGFESRFRDQIARIKEALCSTPFDARRVFVMLPDGSVE